MFLSVIFALLALKTVSQAVTLLADSYTDLVGPVLLSPCLDKTTAPKVPYVFCPKGKQAVKERYRRVLVFGMLSRRLPYPHA